MKQSITSKALDKKTGMTLEEVAAVITRAYRLDMPTSSTVEVIIGFRSQIQSITITQKEETPS
ncbi:hypothetical protein [Brevibacterium moorei]|uniref:hypothetical protein n=1 Tax=Brevibacterium moorei TaxID=2968457 RepID=UPI00211C96C9|nr:hypothetical protein [Brevibacterium sp. 68QC2CO]MCQ9384435.1 hypothetical protein [Brevibacterium sp. 68QC2CO]